MIEKNSSTEKKISSKLKGLTWKRFVLFFNSGAVSVYKVMGMIILTVIVLGMFAYLTASGFYLVNSSWVTPFVLNPDNDKVIQAKLSVLNQMYQLEKMESDLATVKGELRHVEYAKEVHTEFQNSFVNAWTSEQKKMAAELAASNAALKSQMKLTNSDGEMTELYRFQKLRELEAQYASQLITEEEMLKGKFQISQLKTSQVLQKEKLDELKNKNVALRKTVADLKDRTEQLTKESRPALANRPNANLSVLMQEQPLIQSVIAASEMEVRAEALSVRVVTLEKIIAQFRESIDRTQQNPYVRAGENPITVAFVPYENMNNIRKDRKIFGCFLEFIFCKNVGVVTQVLDAEVVGRHPISGREIRGKLVEMNLKDPRWAESRSLVINRAPLLF